MLGFAVALGSSVNLNLVSSLRSRLLFETAEDEDAAAAATGVVIVLGLI